MTDTTLVNAQTVSAGLDELNKTTLQAGTTSLTIDISVTTTLAVNNLLGARARSGINFRYTQLLTDIGTFNAAAVQQIVSASQFFPLSIGLVVGEVRYSKLPLIACEGAYLYTWLEVFDITANGLTLTVKLREYP